MKDKKLSLLKKIKIITLYSRRLNGASLKTQYDAICPYCGLAGMDHKFDGLGTTAGWDYLKQIYQLSCYKGEEENKEISDWMVIRIWKWKFSARSYPRGFARTSGYNWRVSWEKI